MARERLPGERYGGSQADPPPQPVSAPDRSRQPHATPRSTMMLIRSSQAPPADNAQSGRVLLARVLLVTMVAVLLVPLEQSASIAVPVTLSETLDGLPEEAAAAATGVSTPEPPSTPVVRSRSVEAPLTFSAVGFRAPLAVTDLRMRTSIDGEVWEDWVEVDFYDVFDGPDPASDEQREGDDGRHSEPVWVAEANYLQIDVLGASPEAIEVTLIDSMRLNGGPVERVRDTAIGSSADANSLPIVSRAQWGADESITRDSEVATTVHMGVVHHTAHTSSTTVANSYTREQAPGLMRAMHRYHTVTLGWRDLGYNLVIDRFGTIYEGRRGGITKGVVGAHAAGYNRGSFGVAVIGNFVDAEPSAAALASLTEVIALKSAIHGIDPTGWTNQVGNGTWRPTIVGHRDVGQTSCPGRIQGHLPRIREQARTTSVRFPDVPTSSPHRGAILSLADAGVTRGCSTNLFCPEDTLTRAQAASFMVRAFELAPRPGARFSDVRIDATHSPEINALAELGWLQGYPDGTFRPHERLTRAQLASLLSRTFDEPDPWAPSPDPYPDVEPGSTHHPGIMLLASYGIRGNCDGRGSFCPNDPVRRDSTASFVYMVLDAHGPLPTPYGLAAAGVPADHEADVAD